MFRLIGVLTVLTLLVAFAGFSHAELVGWWSFDGKNNRIWVLGATSKIQDYETLPLFSFWEHRLFLRGSFFFRTKTTVIGTIQAGYKQYRESVVNEELIEETIETAGNGNGPGHGNLHLNFQDNEP